MGDGNILLLNEMYRPILRRRQSLFVRQTAPAIKVEQYVCQRTHEYPAAARSSRFPLVKLRRQQDYRELDVA